MRMAESSAVPAPSRSACGGQVPTSYRRAHSHTAADPSEIPLRLSQIRVSGNQPERSEELLPYRL